MPISNASNGMSLYMAELDYKYNTRKDSDGARTVSGLGMVEGKRG